MNKTNNNSNNNNNNTNRLIIIISLRPRPFDCWAFHPDTESRAAAHVESRPQALGLRGLEVSGFRGLGFRAARAILRSPGLGFFYLCAWGFRVLGFRRGKCVL